MASIRVISHIISGMVHGGCDAAASLSLWIDPTAGVAHLCGHSGSMTPLAGPTAPPGHAAFEATGRAGYIKIFDASEIHGLHTKLEDLLAKADPNHVERLRDAIEDTLSDIDLAEEAYHDWTAAHDPGTHRDVYA